MRVIGILIPIIPITLIPLIAPTLIPTIVPDDTSTGKAMIAPIEQRLDSPYGSLHTYGMFTGIIEELGTVVSLRAEANVARLALQAKLVRGDLRIGDSLAVNGVCLTVEGIETAQLKLSMMPETLRRTTLGTLHPGDKVNLERALRLDGRLGGHLVAGHVDGVGALQRAEGVGEERVMTFSLPAEIAPFVVPKGSIAVDGVSLTVVDVHHERFSVSLIRHTLTVTTLAGLTIGAQVNLEADMIARYLGALLAHRQSPDGLTFERLRELGY